MHVYIPIFSSTRFNLRPQSYLRFCGFNVRTGAVVGGVLSYGGGGGSTAKSTGVNMPVEQVAGVSTPTPSLATTSTMASLGVSTISSSFGWRVEDPPVVPSVGSISLGGSSGSSSTRFSRFLGVSTLLDAGVSSRSAIFSPYRKGTRNKHWFVTTKYFAVTCDTTGCFGKPRSHRW